VVLRAGQAHAVPLTLAGGDGALFVRLPEPITRVEFVGAPVRETGGVRVEARVLGRRAVLEAALPLRVELRSGDVQQTVFATTRGGVLSWSVPFLKEFPAGSIEVSVTDLATGRQDRLGTQ